MSFLLLILQVASFLGGWLELGGGTFLGTVTKGIEREKTLGSRIHDKSLAHKSRRFQFLSM
jgi:hypothetical protein